MHYIHTHCRSIPREWKGARPVFISYICPIRLTTRSLTVEKAAMMDCVRESDMDPMEQASQPTGAIFPSE